MKNPFKSVSARLSLQFAVLLALSSIFLSLAFMLVVRYAVRSVHQKELFFAASEISRAVSSGDFSHIPYNISYLVLDSSENVLFTNDPFLPNLPDSKGIAKTFFQKDFFLDGDLKLLYISIFDESRKIVAAMNTDGGFWESLISVLPISTALVLIPILVFSFLLSLFITRKTLRPVSEISRLATRISASNLGEVLPESGSGDEFDFLAQTFNALLLRLKADFERERQFTSDVSHELKTPVAVILGQANLLVRWGKNDAEQLEKSLDSIQREAKSMNALISNLLNLSRLESGRLVPKKEIAEIRQILERTKSEFELIAPEMKIKIEGNAEFSTDSELLHQIITAIFSNSLKYAGKSCTVQAKIEQNESGAIVQIFDDGDGFPESAIPHIFERFFRADEAHTRSGGTGLGLAIAQSAANALGGKIIAGNAQNGGAMLTIFLEK